MHHRLLWLATAATALLLQACAQQPSGPPPRVFAADMTGAAKVCTAPPVTPAAGHTVDAAIKLGNDGGWCAITVNNNGRPFDAGLLAYCAGAWQGADPYGRQRYADRLYADRRATPAPMLSPCGCCRATR